MKSPCYSSPCQNQAMCVTNYKYGTFKCLCGEGFTESSGKMVDSRRNCCLIIIINFSTGWIMINNQS